MKNDFRSNIKRVFWLFVLLFVVLGGFIIKFMVVDRSLVVSNSYNRRLKAIDNQIVRGEIRDSSQRSLAVTDSEGIRQYPYAHAFAHVVGYLASGSSGVEAKYNFQLQHLHNEIYQRFRQMIMGTPLQANDLVLTIDADLQTLIHEENQKQEGGVVVLEPSTGKILALHSYPDFDPNSIEQNWSDLSSDTDNSPLLNRATQGLYPPGSIFKIVTTAAAYESIQTESDEQAAMNALNQIEYTCDGYAHFGGSNIRCFNETAHGTIDMTQALTVSCNTYFSELGISLGVDQLRITAEKLYFNKTYPFVLEYTKSSFPLSETATVTGIAQTAIGQGETLTTPLHMAMITAALANGGLLMQPYLVDYEQTETGAIVNKVLPRKLDRLFTLDEADYIKTMMVNVVENGTGVPVTTGSIQIAAKTGTAENTGEDHGWFVAFAPADDPQVAIAIAHEQSGGPKKAMALARKIIEHVVQ